MANRSNGLTRWRSREEDRTADLAGMVVRLAGQHVKMPGWLLPIIVAELWGLRWDTFNTTYYLRQRNRARTALTRLLTPEEQSQIATWHAYGGALDDAESEQSR